MYCAYITNMFLNTQKWKLANIFLDPAVCFCSTVSYFWVTPKLSDQRKATTTSAPAPRNKPWTATSAPWPCWAATPPGAAKRPPCWATSARRSCSWAVRRRRCKRRGAAQRRIPRTAKRSSGKPRQSEMMREEVFFFFLLCGIFYLAECCHSMLNN